MRGPHTHKQHYGIRAYSQTLQFEDCYRREQVTMTEFTITELSLYSQTLQLENNRLFLENKRLKEIMIMLEASKDVSIAKLLRGLFSLGKTDDQPRLLEQVAGAGAGAGGGEEGEIVMTAAIIVLPPHHISVSLCLAAFIEENANPQAIEEGEMVAVLR